MRPASSRTVLALLCALYLILFVNRVNISTAAPLIRADLALSNTQLGLIFSAFAIPYALFQLVGGWIGDRFGARRTLAVCCTIVAATTVLTGAAGGFGSLCLLRLILGFGEGAAFPTATRAMSEWLPVDRWGFAQGITHAFARIGNALTPPLMAAMLALTSWRISFALLGFASCGWILLWVWYMDASRAATFKPHRPTPDLTTIPWMRLARRILPVTIVDFCYGWTLWLFLTWIPTFFFENYHLNLQASALFSAGVLFAGVIGDTAGGVFSDRLLRRTGNLRAARRNVIIVGFLGSFAFLVPVIMIHRPAVAALCLSLAFLFAELIVAPIWAVPMDIAPRYAASASGMMNFGFGVAGLVSPSSFGYLVDRTGSWVLPFISSTLLLLLGAALAARLHPEKPFAEATAA